MLEKIIIDICNQMSESLSDKQLQELKNIIYINFHNKKVVEECTSVIQLEQDPDNAKLKMFAVSKKVSGIADSSIRKYLQDLKVFKSTINKSFEDVTTMDIRWYLAYCQEKRNNKLTTVDGIRSSLSCFYNFLETEELILKNPMKRIDTLKVPKEVKKAFSTEELEAIRTACVSYRQRALIEMLYSTGLRVSELCSLNVGDIDLRKKEFVVSGKGNKERVLYISDTAFFHLRRYLKERCQKENCNLEELNDVPLFISTRKKQRMNKSGIEWILRDLGKKAMIKDVHPHRFRRTFATDLLNRGMKIEQVMLLMGHSKLDTTMIYFDITKSSIENTFRRYA